MTTTESTAVRQTPNSGIAAILGFLVPPLGMLYVRRPGWAVGYVVMFLLLGTAVFFVTPYSGPLHQIPGALGWIIAIAAAIHAVKLAQQVVPGERPWYSRWYGLIGSLSMLGLALVLPRLFLFEPYHMTNTSMHPSIREHSALLLIKPGYGNYSAYGVELLRRAANRRIERGDVVIIRSPENPSTQFVSRIIGRPGDHIEYRNRRLTINGVAVPVTPGRPDATVNGIDYQYGVELIDGRRIEVAWMRAREARTADAIVPAGHFMLLSDNRDNARDSRYYGMVPQANILGLVTVLQFGASKP